MDCKNTHLLDEVRKVLNLPEYFLYVYMDQQTHLVVQNVKYLVGNIIPFFDKYPFIGPKKVQYDGWKKGVMLKYNCKTPCREVMEEYLKAREEIQMSTKSKRKYKYNEIVLADGTKIGKEKEQYGDGI